MSTVAALFQALIISPENTEFEIAVSDKRDAENIRVNLVKRLSNYRGQLAVVIPDGQLPRSLKFKYNSETNTATVSIGEKAVKDKAVTFRIVDIKPATEDYNESSS